METEALTLQLKRKIRKERLVTLGIFLVCLAAILVLAILREHTKIVTVREYPFGIGQRRSVSYRPGYGLAMVFPFTAGILSGLFCLLSCLSSRVDTVTAGGSSIVLFRSLTALILYVDGREKARSGYYLDAPLKDGSTVTVSLSRNRLYAHMSFSNGHPPLDL